MSAATNSAVSLTADDCPALPAVDPARALRPVSNIVRAYVAVSAVTLMAIALLRNHPGIVNTAVWTRGTIVVLSSLLMLRFAHRAASGARRAFLRLRLVSAVMLVAIVAIVALPGTFPLWMKAEQGACGLLLVGVVRLVNGRGLRSRFAAR